MSKQLELPDGVERRMVEMDVRSSEDDQPILEGTAAVFDTVAEIMPGFFEQIKPGAFSKVLKTDDTRALFNHSSDFPLGRKSAGTLELRQDAKGLHYKIDLPDTQIGRDLPVSIKRGDITGRVITRECFHRVPGSTCGTCSMRRTD